MSALVVAEVSRLLSRRFTVIAAVVVLLGLAAYQIAVNVQISPPTGAERAAAQQAYEEELRFYESNRAEIEQSCAEAGVPLEQCAPPPSLDNYLGTVAFDDVLRGSLQLAVYLVALAAFLVAGSFIGAEYTSGSIANWLTFLPRRGRVFAAKLVTVVAFSVLAGALASAFVITAAVVLARLYAVPATGLPGALALGGRGLLAAAALAILGFCIGLLSRHTAAAIGVLVGYLFVWFVRSAILADAAWAQQVTRWTPEANLAAIVDRGYTYVVPQQTLTREGINVDYVERTVSLTHGLVYWGVLLGVVVVATALIFRRRDVS